jgi:uncharacterized protein YoxC
MADLDTTNMWLAIMAIVAVLEALVVIGLAIGGFMAYRRVMALVDGLEQRHIAPLTARANAILDDVKAVTAKVQLQTDRVDHAIAGTMDRVDETAERVRHTVADQVDRIASIVRGVRAAFGAWFGNGRRGAPGPYADAGTAGGPH